MSLNIIEGRRYVTRGGEIVGPMVKRTEKYQYPDHPFIYGASSANCYRPDGSWHNIEGLETDHDLVREVVETPAPSIPSPIVTETTTRVKPGVYGRLHVSGPDGTWKDRPILLAFVAQNEPDDKPPFRAALNASEIRSAIETLTEILTHLEETTNGR